MKRNAFALVTVFCVAGWNALAAQDLTVKASPKLSVPLGEPGSLFTPGPALDAALDLELFGVLAPEVQIGFGAFPAKNVGTSFATLRAGAGLGGFYYVTPRVKLALGGAAGLYQGTYENTQTGVWWNAAFSGGWRFSPTFTLLGTVGYDNYVWRDGPVYTGLTVGVTACLAVGSLGASSGGVQTEAVQDGAVFPIRYRAYREAPVAELTLTNREQAEIRNVKVTFSAGAYSSEPMPCASIGVIARGASVTVPLYAAFGERVLGLSEATKLQCEVVVTYELLGAPRESRKSESIAFNHRNALRWTDPRVVASFVSPNDPAVLDFSKFVAGLVRDKVRPELDKNLQYAMGVFESLRLAGIVGAPDPSTPYAAYHADPALVDYLQYPYQTLAYKSGDSDDLAVLYAAMLSSVGVPSAYAILDSEMIVVVPVSVKAASIAESFTNSGDFIVRQGAVYVPVRVSAMREGFLRAWVSGAELWRQSGGKAALTSLEDAWKAFPAIGIADAESAVSKPREAQVTLAFDNAVSRFIDREIGPKVDAMKARLGPNSSARDHNNLGVLCARYGYYDDAVKAFEKAAALGSAPAVTNLANIAFLRKDYPAAETWFRKALDLQADNKNALVGLARTLYELDEYEEADRCLQKVREQDPALADRYSYLSSGVDSTVGRASAAAADRSGAMAWDDAE